MIGIAAMDPSAFEVNEAWIAFQLNDVPIQTAQDGSFNCIALMDAATGYIVANGLVTTDRPEGSQFNMRRLLKDGRQRQGRFPSKLLLPIDQFQTILPAEAARSGIIVARVSKDELRPFLDEAREGFREHTRGGRPAANDPGRR